MHREIQNDLIRISMERAAETFAGNSPNHGMFSNASFSQAVRKLIGVEQTLDGGMVNFLLGGRTDVRRLEGYHFQLLK